MSEAYLHILILTDRDWTHPQGGGTGTTLHQQVVQWLEWGHRVSVISCSHPGAARCERGDRLTLYHVGGRSTVFPQTIVRQWRGLVPDADVVIEVVNGVTFLTPLWCRKPRLTLIYHIHRDHYVAEMGGAGRLAALLLETLPLRLLYRRSRLLTISEATARDIARHGIARHRIAVNCLGVDLEQFTPEAGARAAEPTLLYLGRLKRYKRIEVVLDVLERNPGAVLELAGDGDHRAALLEAIERRRLTDRVRVHGHVSEQRKLELYRRAWVNVTASSAEGWGLSVSEAAACGTPSAALAVGGLVEAIEDGHTGFLAADPIQLAEKVSVMLGDRALVEALGRNACAAASELSWAQTARRTLSLLDEQRRRAVPGALPAAGLRAPVPAALPT